MTEEEKRIKGMFKFQELASGMTKLEKFTLAIFNNEDFAKNPNYCYLDAVEKAEQLLCEIAFAESVHKIEEKEY